MFGELWHPACSRYRIRRSLSVLNLYYTNLRMLCLISNSTGYPPSSI